jgi:hypothetical protein
MLTKSVDTFSVLPRTRGFVRILYGNIDVGRIYQLCLEDGTEVSFFARYTNGLDQPHATYSVTVSGDPEG